MNFSVHIVIIYAFTISFLDIYIAQANFALHELKCKPQLIGNREACIEDMDGGACEWIA